MTWVNWYSNAVDALRSLRGVAGLGTDGQALPALRPMDTIAVLGQFSRRLIESIESFMASQNDHEYPYHKRAIPIWYVDGDSMVAPLGAGRLFGIRQRDKLILTEPNPDVPSISIAEYVAGKPHDGKAWQRRTPDDAVNVFTIWIEGKRVFEEHSGHANAYADAMAKWQRAVDASAHTITNAAAGMQTQIAHVDLDNFISAIRALSFSMDAVVSNPPPTDWQQVRNALAKSANATADFVGQAAADVADKAGELAGHVAEGFFSQASAMSLIVAGLAVWLFLK